MKWLFVSLFFVSIGQAEEGFNSFFSSKCQKQAAVFFKKFNVSDNKKWTSDQTYKGHKVRKVRTDQVGRWITIYLNNSGTPSFLEITDASVEQTYSFNQKGCLIKKEKERKWPTPRGLVFSDKDLRSLINKKKRALIYLWSPDMVLSQKFWKRFYHAALQNNLEFIPVLRKKMKSKYLKVAFEKWKMPSNFNRLNISNEIKMIDATVHSPTTVLVKNGKMSSQPIVGLLGRKSLQSRIANELKALK